MVDIPIKLEPTQNASTSPQLPGLKRGVSPDQLDSPEKRQRVEPEATQSFHANSLNENVAPQSTNDEDDDDLGDLDLDAIIAGAVAHVSAEYQDVGTMEVNAHNYHQDQFHERNNSTTNGTQNHHSQNQASNNPAAYERLRADHQLSLQVLSLMSLESLVWISISS